MTAIEAAMIGRVGKGMVWVVLGSAVAASVFLVLAWAPTICAWPGWQTTPLGTQGSATSTSCPSAIPLAGAVTFSLVTVVMLVTWLSYRRDSAGMLARNQVEEISGSLWVMPSSMFVIYEVSDRQFVTTGGSPGTTELGRFTSGELVTIAYAVTKLGSKFPTAWILALNGRTVAATWEGCMNAPESKWWERRQDPPARGVRESWRETIRMDKSDSCRDGRPRADRTFY